jgi:hypothetical protein
MINRMAVGVVAGLLTKVTMDFYLRYKEVDEFGRMPFEQAAEMVLAKKGTVAQQERLTALAIANLHAAADAQQLRQGMSQQTLDPRNPEDLAKLQKLLSGATHESANTGQYL